MEPHPIKVLLVDDEAGYINILARRMMRIEFQVQKAYNGSEAIKILRKNEFDVAVLDLKMEDMDGIEVLKIFKKMDPDLAVIMLTGHGSSTAAKEGLDFGADDYLIKPCELDDLISKIREAHEKRRKNVS